MTARADDDLPRRVLQHLANGKRIKEALEAEGLNYKRKSLSWLFNRRCNRQGYKTTYEMLAHYVSEGLVHVDKKVNF